MGNSFEAGGAEGRAALHVVVVEDDEQHAALARAYLEHSPTPMQVSIATSLAEATQVLTLETVDCVLLDLGLPDVSDFDGLHRLVHDHPAVPVVVMTGRDEEEASAAALRLGAEDFLAKPDLTAPILRRMVLHAIERHQQRVAMLEDLTARTRAEAQLRQLAQHDPVTGLGNRVLLERRIARAANEERTGEPLALLFIDLDGFKQVNDTMGHAAGDELLATVGRRIQAVIRATDTAVRLGGDEFVVVVGAPVDGAVAVALAERLRAAIAQPSQIGGGLVAPTASIGVALSSGAGSVDGLLQAADAAMYRAKAAGKDRVDVWHAPDGAPA